jgi:Nicotinic acid phosphoribosyltransferase
MYNSVLLTDLYQLTMLQGYYEQNMEEPAVFEFFVRKLPKNRSYLVAAGLAQVLTYLEQLHFLRMKLTGWQVPGNSNRQCLIDLRH